MGSLNSSNPENDLKTAKETLMYRIVFWTLWERERERRREKEREKAKG